MVLHAVFQPIQFSIFQTILLTLLAVTITGTASGLTCAESASRHAAEFSNKTRKLVWKNNETTIPTCIVTDLAECFPMQFNQDTSTTEYYMLKESLVKLGVFLDNLRELPIREPNGLPKGNSKFNDKFQQRLDDLELELKGFFCKSGKCVLHDKATRTFWCQVGSAVDSPIQLTAYQDKVSQLNKEIDQFRLIENICTETIGSIRSEAYYYAKEYNPDVGQLQRTEGGPVETVKLCVISGGGQCFPNSEAEVKVFEHYYGQPGSGVIPLDKLEERRFPSIVKNPRLKRPTYPKQKEKEKKNLRITMEFKSWFCYSGKCANGKCTNGDRKSTVFKSYLVLSSVPHFQPVLSAVLLVMSVVAILR